LPRRCIRGSPLQVSLEGLLYVRAHPPVLGLILLSVVPFLFGMPLNTLLPAFNEQVLNGGPDDLGLLISCMGGGAILGSLLLAALGNLRRRAQWVIASALAWGVLTACFGAASHVLLASVVVALIGLVSAWNMALNRGLLQTEVTPAMRGRIMSIDMMSHGLMPLGVLPISLIADRFGLAAALESAGVVFVVAILLLASGTRAVRGLRERHEPALP